MMINTFGRPVTPCGDCLGRYCTMNCSSPMIDEHFDLPVAERLYAALVIDRRKTVTAVAQELGMSRAAFSNVINGNAELSIELALKIEALYGIDARRILIDQLIQKIDAVSQVTG